MHENHQREQYFFDAPTIAHLSAFLAAYDHVCCLCAPTLGRALAAAGRAVTLLDLDERFAGVPGFQRYDLYRPAWLGTAFDLLICDPPFFNVSLSQLFSAIRVLARHRFEQPLLVSYLCRRQDNVLGTFAPFALRPTGYRPGYQTVEASERNAIEFYGNLSDDEHQRLRQGG